MSKTKGWQPIRPLIVDYLRKHPNEIVMVNDMKIALGLSKEQIQAQMRLLIKDGLSVRIVSQASAWQFVPGSPVAETMNGNVPAALPEETAPEPVKEPEETKRVFVQIGTTRAGAPLVQDAEGVIYVARELE